MNHTYIATLTKTVTGQYEVEFPDLAPAAATFGDTLTQAVTRAQDALEGYLLVAEDIGEPLPPASDESQLNVREGQLIVPIVVDTKLARYREENKMVKKTLTIPAYLN